MRNIHTYIQLRNKCQISCELRIILNSLAKLQTVIVLILFYSVKTYLLKICCSVCSTRNTCYFWYFPCTNCGILISLCRIHSDSRNFAHDLILCIVVDDLIVKWAKDLIPLWEGSVELRRVLFTISHLGMRHVFY